MKGPDLTRRITRIAGESASWSEDDLTIAQLLGVQHDINRFLIDEIIKAPCDHKNTHNYTVGNQTRCGICQRHI